MPHIHRVSHLLVKPFRNIHRGKSLANQPFKAKCLSCTQSRPGLSQKFSVWNNPTGLALRDTKVGGGSTSGRAHRLKTGWQFPLGKMSGHWWLHCVPRLCLSMQERPSLLLPWVLDGKENCSGLSVSHCSNLSLCLRKCITTISGKASDRHRGQIPQKHLAEIPLQTREIESLTWHQLGQSNDGGGWADGGREQGWKQTKSCRGSWERALSLCTRVSPLEIL